MFIVQYVRDTLTVATLSVYLRKVQGMLIILKHGEKTTFCFTEY
jgi:hypothetical protein